MSRPRKSKPPAAKAAVKTGTKDAAKTAAKPAPAEPAVKSKASTYLYAAAALLALVGLADSIYLTVEHLAGRSVPCTITGGCEQVLNSPYSTVGPVPLSALGAAAYFTAFSLATLAAFGYRRAGDFMLYLAAVMLAVSVYLFVLQAFVLKAFCQFCLLSAVITLLLAIIVATEHFYFRRRR
ncbi:MAG TPA: vitamin K epoxide reductase family protein [Pyrinomonadaceae bacterium]|nr:vitamin K epoxide reductase family protein [Pyrinomonadaceae bacterium]